MSKVYAVIEFGGQYEDAWEFIRGVCKTKKLAEALKLELEKRRTEPNISEEEWFEMAMRIDEIMEDAKVDNYDYVEEAKKLYPSYSEEDLRAADLYYNGDYWDYCGVRIQEVEYYDNLSNINDGTNNQ